MTAHLEKWRRGPGLEFLGKALDPFPDLMAGFVQAVLGGVVMDPDVSWERAEGERAFRVDRRALKATPTSQHPALRTPGRGKNLRRAVHRLVGVLCAHAYVFPTNPGSQVTIEHSQHGNSDEG